MTTLAPSLKLLFRELDVHWPHRDRRTDGWRRNCRYTGGSSSDHCYDSAGRVHAIDVDKDGINADWFVSRLIYDHLPTKYVIWNRHIWSRSHGWTKRVYTGTSNPHTDHVHVSIEHTTAARNFSKGWGVAGGSSGFGSNPAIEADTSTPWNYSSIIQASSSDFIYYAARANDHARAIRGLRQ